MPRLSALFGRSAPLGITLRRFPLSVALATAFALLAVLHNHGNAFLDTALETDVFATLVIGFFWALSASLAASARAWPRWVEMALALMAIALTFLLLRTTPDEVAAPIILLGEAVLLTTLAAASPGLRPSDNESLWRFTAVALEGAAIALIAAVILAAGLSALVFSITYLFELRDPGRLIPDIWVVCMSLVWPLRALSTLPPANAATEKPALQFNTALSFLIDWALVPIWFAYLALLYAYAAKILIEGSLPRGGVAWMVHGFGALGVAIWLMAWPRRDTAVALTRRFHRWFWATLPVPLLLLAIGVAERVSTYGWTEPRYMVALGGVWLAIMAAIYGTRRHRVPLALAPLSLAALCVLATFGPWSAVNVSVRDQQARLAQLLTQHGILVEGRIVPVKDPTVVPSADVSMIRSAIRFLLDHDRIEAVRAWYPSGTNPPGHAYDSAAADQMVIAMGLQPQSRPGTTAPLRRNIVTIYGQPSWMRDRTPALIEMSGFDLVGQAVFIGNEGRHRMTAPAGSDYVLQLSHANLQLRIETPSGGTATIDLGPACAQLYAGPDYPQTAEQSRPAIVTATGDVRARIAIQTIALDKTPTGLVIRELTFLIALADR